MNYVVVDLEWNQAMSSKSSVFNKLPIHLRGEIIQIGAVKLNADMSPGDEFQIDVKPVWFKRMHYKVKKLTGFDKERLSHGAPFAEAFAQFREWCGEDATFLTWGFDDQGIMEQNIIIHDLDWDWIAGWVNLQLIYNLQTGGDKNQKSLQTAMEHFGIEQTRVAHDALGDAYNTALVCSRLDMASGLAQYAEAPEILARRTPKAEKTACGRPGAHSPRRARRLRLQGRRLCGQGAVGAALPALRRGPGVLQVGEPGRPQVYEPCRMSRRRQAAAAHTLQAAARRRLLRRLPGLQGGRADAGVLRGEGRSAQEPRTQKAQEKSEYLKR